MGYSQRQRLTFKFESEVKLRKNYCQRIEGTKETKLCHCDDDERNHFGGKGIHHGWLSLFARVAASRKARLSKKTNAFSVEGL